MDRAASGDDGAFGSLALAVQGDLYRFALAHGLKQADAAESVQETFLRAYRMRKSWRVGGDALGWLYGIAMNVVREFHRRNHRRPAEGLELDSLTGAEYERPGAVGQGNGPPAGHESDREARRRLLVDALVKLPPRQQEAVSCRYLLEMSLRETADVMGCAEGTVKASVFAGLENLRKLIKLEPD